MMTTDGPVPAELPRLVSAAEFRNIPPEVIDVAKTLILDGLAVTRAGSRYVDHRNRTLDDGSVRQEVCERPRRIWCNPLSRRERLVKVRACASRVLASNDVETLIDVIEGLEHTDAGEIAGLCRMLAASK